MLFRSLALEHILLAFTDEVFVSRSSIGTKQRKQRRKSHSSQLCVNGALLQGLMYALTGYSTTEAGCKVLFTVRSKRPYQARDWGISCVNNQISSHWASAVRQQDKCHSARVTLAAMPATCTAWSDGRGMLQDRDRDPGSRSP